MVIVPGKSSAGPARTTIHRDPRLEILAASQTVAETDKKITNEIAAVGVSFSVQAS